MAPDEARKPSLLITGGCGRIGSYFARHVAGRYTLRLVDRVPWDADKLGDPPGETVVAALHDLDACRAAAAGMERILHLAADPSPKAEFYESLLENNFLATYNMFHAAHEAGCRRFVFASSVHAVAAYPGDVQVSTRMPVRPTSLYGVSKVFGEALAAHYGVNLNMSSVAVRIGAHLFPQDVKAEEADYIDAYLHPDDLNQLLVQCLETPNITFAIAHAISNNRYKRIDLSDTRELFGYDPQVDGFELIKEQDK